MNLELTLQRTGSGTGDILVEGRRIGRVFRESYGWMAVVYGIPEMWPLGTNPSGSTVRRSWTATLRALQDRWDMYSQAFWLYELTTNDGFRIMHGRDPVGVIWRPPSEITFRIRFDNLEAPQELDQGYATVYEAIQALRGYVVQIGEEQFFGVR